MGEKYVRAGRFSCPFFCSRRSFFRPAPSFDVVMACFWSDNTLLLLLFLACVTKLYTFNVCNLLKLQLIVGGKWFSQKGRDCCLKSWFGYDASKWDLKRSK